VAPSPSSLVVAQQPLHHQPPHHLLRHRFNNPQGKRLGAQPQPKVHKPPSLAPQAFHNNLAMARNPYLGTNMDHVITLKDVLIVSGIFVAVFGVIGLIVWFISSIDSSH
jgi:hypothetical protein